MIFVWELGSVGVNETEHHLLTFCGRGESEHCGGENPAEESPVGVGPNFQETTPVGMLPLEPTATALHVVL
jgi:hypothetical protein